MEILAKVPVDEIQVTITYLETREKPPCAARQIHRENVTIMRAHQPTVSFYRFLYNTVGQPWLWYERRQMSDEALRQIIHHAQVEVYVLYAGGVPAGYAELDWRQAPEVELAYFGLMPEFIGKGLGALLMDEMHEKVWLKQPQRFWLHTCTLDHPHALAFYQRAGFVPYKQEVKIIDDPRTLSLM
jgi:GNAT superfamily N-acetyltransferase